MKIKLSPQLGSPNKEFMYTANNETLYVHFIDNQQNITISDYFDFSGFTEEEVFTGVETNLPINPITNVDRQNGELFVTVLYWYSDLPKDIEENLGKELIDAIVLEETIKNLKTIEKQRRKTISM